MDLAIPFSDWIALQSSHRVGEQPHCAADRRECGTLRAAGHGPGLEVVSSAMPGAFEASVLSHPAFPERGAKMATAIRDGERPARCYADGEAAMTLTLVVRMGARVPEIAGISAGGMPDRVKCLHVLVAHSLAAGPGVNPLGDEALALLPEWGADGPCVKVGP